MPATDRGDGDSRLRFVIVARFFMDATYDRIGVMLNVTHQRAHQLEAEALSRLSVGLEQGLDAFQAPLRPAQYGPQRVQRVHRKARYLAAFRAELARRKAAA